MNYYKLLTIFLFFGCYTQAWAHPVSFQGAWSLVNESTADTRTLMGTYSHRYWFAPAFVYQAFNIDGKNKKQEFYTIGANILLKRFNNSTSQANIYLSGGYGLEKTQHKSKKTGRIDLDIDWENRRYYFASQYSHLIRDGSIQDKKMKKLRLGFAPYLGDFEHLNTWFILQLKQLNNEQVEATPLLRFYYKNVLWEIGSSFKGNWLFNFMLHL